MRGGKRKIIDVELMKRILMEKEAGTKVEEIEEMFRLDKGLVEKIEKAKLGNLFGKDGPTKGVSRLRDWHDYTPSVIG